MGQFSWLDCIDNSQILDDVQEDVYVLIPKEFGGGHIKETCYDGYGNFGGNDIYELVADWNRKFLATNPKLILPTHYIPIGRHAWYKIYGDLSIDRDEMIRRLDEDGYHYNYRWIGICIDGYDEDNAELLYPIKITHDSSAIYEECNPSLIDPNQGWRIYYEE